MKLLRPCVCILALFALLPASTEAFAASTQWSRRNPTSGVSLRMGLFDKNRRKPQAERIAYFNKVEERRQQATTKQNEMWAWQTKTYKKGEDPLTEWKKRRADGSISDLNDQYGDPKKIGGIPLPMASFGVGGEFGVSICEDLFCR
jgi:hypothetical protein